MGPDEAGVVDAMTIWLVVVAFVAGVVVGGVAAVLCMLHSLTSRPR